MTIVQLINVYNGELKPRFKNGYCLNEAYELNIYKITEYIIFLACGVRLGSVWPCSAEV